MRKLLVATLNPGKFSEIREVFDGGDWELMFLGDFGDIDHAGLVEDGETFSDNAYKKASYYVEKTGMLTLAEDSGLIVDALSGELGVKTRRWGAGKDASDEEWIEYFMKRMEGEKNRCAKFVCCSCLINGDGIEYFEGETSGVITEELMAPILPGLPLSSCFIPEGVDKVYAALSADEKNKISHRGKAIRAVREWLKKA